MKREKDGTHYGFSAAGGIHCHGRSKIQAGDRVQEPLYRDSARKNLNKLNDPSLFIAWLNRITFTVCYDMNSKNKQNSNQLMENEEFENIADTSIQDNPEALYQKKEISHSLKEALEELPFYEKEVIIMRFYNDMKLNEQGGSRGHPGQSYCGGRGY